MPRSDVSIEVSETLSLVLEALAHTLPAEPKAFKNDDAPFPEQLVFPDLDL